MYPFNSEICHSHPVLRAKEAEMLVTLRKEADVKQLELYTAQRLARHATWDKEYLLTSPQAGPRLYWQPVRDNQATRRLRERHQAEREDWKVGTFILI